MKVLSRNHRYCQHGDYQKMLDLESFAEDFLYEKEVSRFVARAKQRTRL